MVVTLSRADNKQGIVIKSDINTIFLILIFVMFLNMVHFLFWLRACYVQDKGLLCSGY